MRALGALTAALARRARAAGVGAVAGGRWLAAEIEEIAPKIPIRDADTLHKQYPGRSDEEIAHQLIRTAKRTTAALGAAAGALASVEFVATPSLLLAPVQIAAELLVVAAVEIKLVAELHEVLGSPVEGSTVERASAYLMSWVTKRPASLDASGGGVSVVLSTAAMKELRAMVVRRMKRNSATLMPFMAGALAGAQLNRRATAELGETLVKELTGRPGKRWFRRV